jgi:hypothetical protein
VARSRIDGSGALHSFSLETFSLFPCVSFSVPRIPAFGRDGFIETLAFTPIYLNLLIEALKRARARYTRALSKPERCQPPPSASS